MDSAPNFSNGRGRGPARRARRDQDEGARPSNSGYHDRRAEQQRRRRDEPDVNLPMLTLPSIPSLPAAYPDDDDDFPPISGKRRAVREPPDRYEAARDWDDAEWSGKRAWRDHRDDDRDDYRGEYDPGASGPRRREHSAARPLSALTTLDEDETLALVAAPPAARLPDRLPTDSVPDLAVFHAPRPRRRPRVDTRALVQSARSPWAVARMLLAICAVSLAIWTALLGAGEPSQPLMAGFVPQAGAHDARSVAALVQPETQGMRPDLYDSTQQFNDWWNAACSSAVSSEILTAWGVPHATIGKMIDVMQPDVSLNGGLLTPHGFERGAEAFGYRADINWHLDYKQMLYITNTLGLPLIVNVRISYGYYHFFDGGHFLVMTGGDSQGLSIVDSSEYYIKYLPLDTFNSMFTGMTAVIVPHGYTYNIPNI
ncbi:MAG TPA: hypothetical protein VJN88_13960 [Ktedonobacterales bacterium]|nr:hypothetical protein [Ktedonobacterales bacterium]